MNRGQALVYIAKLDIGIAKITRVKGYFNKYFTKNPDGDVTYHDIQKIANMSRQQITHEKYQLS